MWASALRKKYLGMASVYLGLGTNVGDRGENVRQALDLLGRFMKLLKVSSIYETEPVGFLDQPKFLNAVCQIETGLRPFQLLVLIKGIEAKMGRKPSFPNAPRPIDIDILFYDNLTFDNSTLVIPHPRLAERAFVLVPLAEICPQLRHPVGRKRVSDLLERVGSREEVRLWQSSGGK